MQNSSQIIITNKPTPSTQLLGSKSTMTNFVTYSCAQLHMYLSPVNVTEVTYAQVRKRPQFCLHALLSLTLCCIGQPHLPELPETKNKVSYRKQTARQHLCHKIFGQGRWHGDPVKISSKVF